MKKELARSYAGVGVVLAPYFAVLTWLATRVATRVENVELLLPVLVLVALTFVALVAAAVVRNVSVIRGVASIDYYRTYRDGHPGERVERAARIYDNLVQLPTLFYALCPLLLLTASVDSVQVSLAWLFVSSRVLHAVVYFVWNAVPYRFAMFLMGFVTLLVMWVRFAVAVV